MGGFRLGADGGNDRGLTVLGKLYGVMRHGAGAAGDQQRLSGHGPIDHHRLVRGHRRHPETGAFGKAHVVRKLGGLLGLQRGILGRRAMRVLLHLVHPYPRTNA